MPWLGLLILAFTIGLLVKRYEVRLVLLGSGLLMSTLAGQSMLFIDTFGKAMVSGLVAPICISMGFAATLTVSGCDRNMVVALSRLLRGAGPVLVPACVAAAYFCNLAIPSQASTAAAVGPVLFPLMLGAGLQPAEGAAMLILGCSFGGDLLNPASQDVMALAGALNLPSREIGQRILPASLAGMLVACGAAFWRFRKASPGPPEEVSVQAIQPLRALVPILPVSLLLLAHSGVPALQWLLEPNPRPEFEVVSRGLPVVRAMLIGVIAVALLGGCPRQAIFQEFFQGMGRAYANIISLTICAQCFGTGLTAVGVSQLLLAAVGENPWLSVLLAILFPLGLALLSGSGSGPVLAFAHGLLTQLPRAQSARLAALAGMSGAFGRTLSPVSAVVLYGSGLAQVTPLEAVRNLVVPLAWGAVCAWLVLILAPL
jgi:DcuC family C4-dicarboxylate transporter